MRSTGSKIYSKILDLIFPVECLNCELSGRYLCDRCFDSLKLNETQPCLFCGRETVLKGICSLCALDNPLDGIFIATSYDQSLIQKMIWQLKFNYVQGIGHDVARIIAKYLKKQHILELLALKEAEIVPIPLFYKRFRSRGFNQASEIAKELSSLDSRLIFNDCLIRQRNTGSQLGHQKMERQLNVRGAFAVKPGFAAAKSAFLIDDVATTGSTLNEAAAALKDAGVEKVYALVLAKKS